MKTARRWNRLNGSTHHKVARIVAEWRERERVRRLSRVRTLPMPTGGHDE